MEEDNLAPKWGCDCLGHYYPGVKHIIPCCDRPHITQEEYEKAVELKHRAVEGFWEEMDLPESSKPVERNIFDIYPSTPVAEETTPDVDT